jgi:hypothetical protein
MGDVLVLACGDFADRANEIGIYRTQTAVEAMKRMRYDAITLGDRELAMGPAFVKESLDPTKLPVVTTNLYLNGERFGAPYLVLEKNGMKVGIVSALMELGTQYSSVWEIREPFEEIKSILPEVEKQTDFIVALAHIGFTKAFDLAAQFPQIDVIVAGHGSRKTDEPTVAENAIVVKAGNEGKWLGRLDLTLDAEGKISSHKGSLITLGPTVEDDPAVLELYTAFKDSLEKLGRAKAKGDVGAAPDVGVVSTDYAGARWCRSCHMREFNAWLKTGHSKAFARLQTDGRTGDGDCLPCHTTGFGEGGFTSVSETGSFMNVQCEACHGEGKEHINSRGSVKTRQVVAKTCTECHNDEWDPDFNFELKKAQVH